MSKESLNNVIAIDGPAGSGKSTVARRLAQRLGYLYVDTGEIYRALTLKAIRKRLDCKDPKKILDLVKKTRLELKAGKDNKIKIFLEGENVTKYLRSSDITRLVSYIARIPEIRKLMLKLQTEVAGKGKVILEGRDIGTVIIPKALNKFYLDADLPTRIERRYKELKESEKDISKLKVKRDLSLRDKIDSTRKIAPLRKAPDAVYIDTTNMSIREVVERILKTVKIK